jgi:hypothetical protein
MLSSRTARGLAALALTFAATTATAESPKPDFRLDGSVVHDGVTYPTRADWYRSDAFQDHGKCGSIAPPPVSLAAPDDCSMVGTTINPEYDDGRVLVVQVVFHLIERTNGVQGVLTDEMVQSQIDILNEDFRGIVGTPGEGGADTAIEFVLARFDPDGNPTTGINRVVNDAYFTDPYGSPNDMKLALAWDTSRYLNVYSNDAAGLLGYATFPAYEAGGPEDGVVVLWESVGRNSPGGPPYNQGRTLTHEIGHYLGLLHTFEGGCGSGYNAGDLVADTEPEANENYGCPLGTTSCGGATAPVENYMDYTDDACMTNFTAEQGNRLRCSLVNWRLVNTKPTATFEADQDGLDIVLTNASTDAETPTELFYNWDFGDGTTSTEANPVHTYAMPGLYNVTLEVIDPDSGVATLTQTLEVEESSGGCCQASGQDTSFFVLGLPVLLVLRRRRRA